MATSLLDRLLGRELGPAVAMLHPGRVGSTVLGRMLGARPDAEWDAEPFEASSRSEQDRWDRDATSAAEFLQERHGRHPRHAYVFAIKPLATHHLGVLGVDANGLVSLLDDVGVEHHVMLHRRNLLRRIVSGAVGRERGRYHRKASDGPAELTTVHLDPAAVPFGTGATLLESFQLLERAETDLRDALDGRQQLWLTYEDDVEPGPTIGYERICDFVGLPPRDIDVPLRKTTPQPLTEVIENVDEVTDTLAGTPYAWMLEE